MPPVFTPAERLARETFLVLLHALSYPGRVEVLPNIVNTLGACQRIGIALLDLETTFHTTESELDDTFRRTGSRTAPPAVAQYLFFPDGIQQDLIEAVSVGTADFPDRGATLVIGCRLNDGEKFVFRGPGVNGEIEVRIGGLPAWFWDVRAVQIAYPLGWDVFLVDGPRVMGVPRTTMIERA